MDSFERYLDDTYKLVDTLKNSAQGFVIIVYDRQAKRLCVMKQRELNSIPIYQTLKTLDSQNIPQIYRLFERDGKLIVIEEHIDGQTLEEILIYQEWEEELAEKILLQLCGCLSVLHDKNIIHRDLKPSNIMLTEKNIVKLIDFGIARIFKPENSSDTELLGTRGYAPPEQFGLFDFGQTDRRSDIYALGVTFKELLGEDYDGQLKKILDKCTALDPSQRYQSVDEVRAAIIGRKKFRHVKNFFVAVPISLAILFLPQNANFNEPTPQPEKKSVEPQEKPLEPEVKTPAEEKSTTEKIFDAAMIKIPSTTLPEVNLPTPEPLPEINRSPPPAQVETSGKVEMSFFLNGKSTSKEHMVYLEDWQSWARDEYGQILFPANWSGRLRLENHSGKDLINPRLEVDIGQEEKFFDLPAIADGQSLEVEIPLGNKLASPEKGSGHLLITLNTEGEPPIMLGKTFFLVK